MSSPESSSASDSIAGSCRIPPSKPAVLTLNFGSQFDFFNFTITACMIA